ncbi:MAG TPA: MBL fold metallo-hydrolase [Steroidobacteraceae bacterium]|nr:MBL fold metallo-hydrolase [Steroidobacteraceae bacterium]
MIRSVDRRGFLKTLVGGTAAASLGGLAASARARAAEPNAAIEIQKLGEGLWIYTGDGGNVLVARAGDGLALVDGGLPERSHELLDRIRHETGAERIHTLFNTHWHPCQTGSNGPIGDQGATIIAHENTRLWLCYANPVPEETRTYGPLPPKARPNKTFFYKTEQVSVGNEPVEYGYLLQAHTDGDIYVHFKKANVIAAGGVVSGAGWPIIDFHTGGWIVGMTQGLESLINVADDATRIVPAHGPVLTKTDLIAQHTMYSTISARLERSIRKGLGPDEVVALDPTAEFNAQWGDPKAFVRMAFQSLWGHFAPDAS